MVNGKLFETSMVILFLYIFILFSLGLGELTETEQSLAHFFGIFKNIKFFQKDISIRIKEDQQKIKRSKLQNINLEPEEMTSDYQELIVGNNRVCFPCISIPIGRCCFSNPDQCAIPYNENFIYFVCFARVSWITYWFSLYFVTFFFDCSSTIYFVLKPAAVNIFLDPKVLSFLTFFECSVF